ncbi:unnamed protein product [Blepharisma stoltei]|uniref:AAA-ATPase-like domain-containing protein n=1 Tax=Blepharisma stoltei TaxID=1481888 RepID=A0AAU9K6W1_9CILI|nr:unnamed protein product [Blepharisma stoltei]
MDLSESELISRISQANSFRVEGDIEEISTFSIYTILMGLYPNNQVYIMMERFFGKSPFESDSEDSQLLYVKEIENLLNLPGGPIKPIVSVHKNKPDDSWDFMLILPSQGFIPPKIYYRNSKHKHLKLPPLISFLLENKLKTNEIEENKESISGGMLKTYQIVEEQDFPIMNSVQQNEGGWWALFRIFLIISSKCEDYLKRMTSWTPTFYAMQKYFKEAQIDLKQIGLHSDWSERQAWVEDQKLLVLQALNEKISMWEANTNKVCDATNTFADRLEFWKRIINTSKDNANATPKKPFSYNNIDTSIQKSNVKIKKNWKFSASKFTFKNLIRDEIVYVDKTLFIKEVLDDTSDAILITRPRRWGKSINIDMLKTFLGNNGDEKINKQNKALFTEKRKLIINGFSNSSASQKLAIATVNNGDYVEMHAGKYPVIFISFPEVSMEVGIDIREIIRKKFGEAIQSAYVEHRYVLEKLIERLKDGYDEDLEKDIKTFRSFYNDEPNANLEKSIKFLSRVLCEFYHEQVFILIDEYDRPFNHLFSTESYNTVVKFMRDLLSPAIKETKYAKKVVMTGILRCAKDDLFSGINNVSLNSVTNQRYSECFGFTESEVDKILREASVWNTEEDLELNKRQVASWYDGYNIGGHKIYNPWSIMNCLYYSREGEEDIYRAYWIDTGSQNELQYLFKNFTCEEELSELLRTGYLILENQLPIKINMADVSNDKGQFFSLLLHSGYLTPFQAPIEKNYGRNIIRSDSRNRKGIYVIPNKEVKKFVFDILIKNWVENLNIPSPELCKLMNLLNENLENTYEYISIIKNQILNHWGGDNHKEVDFQNLIGSPNLYAGIAGTNEPRHRLLSEVRNEENKRLDSMYLPIIGKSTCVVIHEYKKLYNTELPQVNKTTFEAIMQIYDKGYMNAALSMYELDNYNNYYSHIIVRAMVFYQLTAQTKWNLNFIYHIHEIRDAIKIRDYLKMNQNVLATCKTKKELKNLLRLIVGPEQEEDISYITKGLKRKHLTNKKGTKLKKSDKN